MKSVNRKVTLLSSLGILLVFVLSASAFTMVKQNIVSEATVFVSPSGAGARVNQTFEVSLNVSGVSDLYGWEFKLSWNPSLLEAINVTENSFLRNGADTYIVSKMSNRDGYVLAGCTRLRKVSGASGNGTLATIEFRAKEEGTCTLNLYDTKLVNSDKQLIPHTNIDCIVKIIALLIEGPYYTWHGTEYWIIELRGRRPIRLISNYR